MYDAVLGPVRHLPMTMLEIGLGCTESTTASGWFNVPCMHQWTWEDRPPPKSIVGVRVRIMIGIMISIRIRIKTRSRIGIIIKLGLG